MAHAETAMAWMQHDMASIALQFELWLQGFVPSDGTADEAFEDWREAFYEALDNPTDEQQSERAAMFLSNLQYAITTPTPANPANRTAEKPPAKV